MAESAQKTTLHRLTLLYGEKDKAVPLENIQVTENPGLAIRPKRMQD